MLQSGEMYRIRKNNKTNARYTPLVITVLNLYINGSFRVFSRSNVKDHFNLKIVNG